MANHKPDDTIRQQIEENLKRVYDDALKQPIPDRFQALLDQLREKDKNSGGKA